MARVAYEWISYMPNLLWRFLALSVNPGRLFFIRQTGEPAGVFLPFIDFPHTGCENPGTGRNWLWRNATLHEWIDGIPLRSVQLSLFRVFSLMLQTSLTADKLNLQNSVQNECWLSPSCSENDDESPRILVCDEFRALWVSWSCLRNFYLCERCSTRLHTCTNGD